MCPVVGLRLITLLCLVGRCVYLADGGVLGGLRSCAEAGEHRRRLNYRSRRSCRSSSSSSIIDSSTTVATYVRGAWHTIGPLCVVNVPQIVSLRRFFCLVNVPQIVSLCRFFRVGWGDNNDDVSGVNNNMKNNQRVEGSVSCPTLTSSPMALTPPPFSAPPP